MSKRPPSDARPVLRPILRLVTVPWLMRVVMIIGVLGGAGLYVSRVAAQSLPPSPSQSSSASTPIPAAAPVPTTATAAQSSASPRPRPAAPVTRVAPVLNAPTLSTDDLQAYIDAVVPAIMQRDHIMGATVAVVQGKTPLVIKGYGYDRLTPARRVDPYASLFRLGSMTKTFTWIVARQEVEAGRLSLDAPIATYLSPEIFTEDRNYRPIRLRDLMSHAPGYEDTSLGHLFLLDFSRFEGMDSYLRKHTPRRVRDPGLYASYSNYGAELAARAALSTSKAKDVPSLMELRVFRPLGLDHTTLREPYEPGPDQAYDLPTPMDATLARNLSQGFVWDGASYVPEPFDHAMAMSGALGGSSTASDMARYMALLLNDGELDGVSLYGADTARAFRTPLLKTRPEINGWASGFMIRRTPSGLTTYGHAGSTLWFSSNMVLVPELNLAIFIAANTQTGDTLTESFPDLVLSHLKDQPLPPPAAPAPDQAYANHADQLKALKGEYVSTRRAYGGLEGAITRLLNTVQVGFEDDGSLILSSQNTLTAYVPASNGLYVPQSPDDPGASLTMGALHFIPKAEGTGATAFETASNMARFERVSWIHKSSTLSFMTTLVILSCVFSLIGMGRNHHNLNRPTQAQVRATWISYAIAACWILSIAIFDNWRVHIGDEPVGLFVKWPNQEVGTASFLALLASIGTLCQLGSLYWVFKSATHYMDGWADWQKVAHVALNIVWLFYAIVLAAWGALTFWG
jgi:CubicO group peptidase (beta-lactamase class C family)